MTDEFITQLHDQGFSILLLVSYAIYNHFEKRELKKQHEKEMTDMKETVAKLQEKLDEYHNQDNRLLIETLGQNTNMLQRCNVTLEILQSKINN